MPVYEYKAVDIDRSEATGTVVADTPRQARDMLRDRGLAVLETRPLEKAARQSLFRRRAGDRGHRAAVAFIRELATLLSVGIPLLEALRTLAKQHRGRFEAVIQELSDQVMAGSRLAEAMARRPEYFDELCISIVRVGETTGSLDSALKRLADFKERAHGLRSRLTTALMYPAVVCVVGLGVATFLMTYVVPNLLGTLMQAGKELPAVTVAVKAASDFLVHWWWAILAGIGALVVAFKLVLRSERGRLLADSAVLRIPLVGELIRKETTSRLAVVLAALLRSGLQFVEAVRIARRTLANRAFRRAMDDYEQAVRAGSDIAAPLESSGVFSPVAVQMLAVGQQSGQLEDMLQELAEAYDAEVAVATQRLLSVVEPFLIVCLAVLVGFIAFATILPILEASNVL